MRNEQNYSEDLRWTNQQGLRNWQDIARELERRHGWKITGARVSQICKEAEYKIAQALGFDDPNRGEA